MKNLAIFLLACLLLTGKAAAQPINLLLNVTPKPSPYIADWEKQPNTVSMVLTNTTNAPIAVKVDAKISVSGQLRAQTKIAQAPIINVPPGISTYFAADVLSAQAMQFYSGVQDEVVKTGKLPAGTYELCVQLVSATNTAQVVSKPTPVCRNLFITSYQAPILTQPVNNAELKFNERPVLRWTGVIPAPPMPPTYRVTVFEVLAGQTPITAFQGNQPLIDRTVVGQTQLLWPLEYEPPMTNKRYVWSVQAFDNEGKTLGEPDGRATPFVFFGMKAVNKSNNGDSVVKTGDSLYIGKFVLVAGTLTNPASQNLTGSGTIYVPFLKVPVQVEFTALKVNTLLKRVMSGTVYSKVAAGIPSVQSQIGSAIDGVQGKALNFAQNAVTSAMGAAAGSLVPAAPQQQAITLPLGIKKGVGAGNALIAVVGMQFMPTGAEINALTEIDFSGINPAARVALGVSGLTFVPNGFGDDATGNSDVSMFLAQDYNVASQTSFATTFKKTAGATGGTFLTWNKDGFKKLALDAEVKLPLKWLKKASDGSQISISLKNELTDLTNWSFTATLPKAEIAAAPGFLLETQQITFDQSDVTNPAQMQFPADYKGTKTNLWKGIFIKTATITLPSLFKKFNDNLPLTFAGNNIILDNAGVSAALSTALNLTNLNFGGWGGTIQDVSLKLVSNSLAEGSLKGGIQLPIAKSTLPYTATISLPQNSSSLTYEFALSPPGELDVPMWAAKFALDKNTSVKLTNAGNTFMALATLNGSLTLNGSVGSINSMDFKGIKFENFKIGSSGVKEVGTWSFASPDHAMAGLPVAITNVNVTNTNDAGKNGIELGFTLDCHLAGEMLSGSTALKIRSEISSSAGQPQAFAFKGVNVEKIIVAGDLPGVTVDGAAKFYNGDKKYGNGFFGKLDGTFEILESKISIVGQFGKKDASRYWFVDAGTVFKPGIALPPVPAISFYGFQGGVFKNMTIVSSGVTKFDTNAIGSTLSGRVLEPTTSGGGFNVGADIGLTGADATFNSNVNIAADFSSDGLGTISLKGTGYIMTPIADRKTPAENNMAYGTVDLSYDAAKKIFDGDFGFYVNVPAKTGTILKSTSQIELYFAPEQWYIFYGRPDKMNGYTLLGLATVEGYFITGKGPEFSSAVSSIKPPQAVLSKFPNFPAVQGIDNGQGLAFGAFYGLSTGRQKFLIFYGEINAGAGFNVALIKQNITCANVSGGTPGVNGWYAFGNAYAYLNGAIGIHVDLWVVEGDFTIMDVGAAAIIQAQLPNPTWMKGDVAGNYSILDGLVEGDFRFEFQVGEKCEIKAVNPFDKIDIIQDILPAQGSKDVSVFAAPSATFNVAVGKEFEFMTLDAAKSTPGNDVFIKRRIRFDLQEAALLKNNIAQDGTTSMGDGKLSVTFLPGNAFSSYTDYKFRVTVRGMEFINNQWVNAKKSDGSPAFQTKEVSFKSGPQPDDLYNFVDNSNFYPVYRQRFYLQNELKKGKIVLKYGNPECLTKSGNLVARFTPLGNSPQAFETPFTFDGNKTISFTINKTLLNDKIYRIEFVRSTTAAQAQVNTVTNTQQLAQGVSLKTRRRFLKAQAMNITAGKTLYNYEFRTSHYNSLKEKIADVKPLLPPMTKSPLEKEVLGYEKFFEKLRENPKYRNVKYKPRRQMYQMRAQSEPDYTYTNFKSCPPYDPAKHLAALAPCNDGISYTYYVDGTGAGNPCAGSLDYKYVVFENSALYTTREPFDKADQVLISPHVKWKEWTYYYNDPVPALTDNEISSSKANAALVYGSKAGYPNENYTLDIGTPPAGFDNYELVLTYSPSGSTANLRQTMGSDDFSPIECPKGDGNKDPIQILLEKMRDSRWNPDPGGFATGLDFFTMLLDKGMDFGSLDMKGLGKSWGQQVGP